MPIGYGVPVTAHESSLPAPTSPLAALTKFEQEAEPGEVVAPFRLASHRIKVDGASGQIWSTHAHLDHELLWGVDGLITVRTPDSTFAVPNGVSIWIPACVPHEVYAAPDTTLMCTWLTDEYGHSLDEVGAILARPLLDGVLAHLMENDFDEPARARAEAFAIDLIEPSPTMTLRLPLPRTSWLREIADAVLDDPAENRSVSEWALAARVSVRTLMRHFAAEVGMPFSEWRMQARIHHAMQRLSLGESVAATAHAAGFAHPSAFAAAFRRHTGTTPRAYARMVAG